MHSPFKYQDGGSLTGSYDYDIHTENNSNPSTAHGKDADLLSCSSEPGPAATMVGSIVMGTRIGGASGREIADIEEDSDMARKVWN